MAKKQHSDLIVLLFDGYDSAGALYHQIEHMEKEKLLVVEDAVVIEREGLWHVPETSVTGSFAESVLTAENRKPLKVPIHVRHTYGKKGKYAAAGGGLGLLAAAILGGPVGLTVVAAASLAALAAALTHFGVNYNTIEAVKHHLQPDTSALLLLGRVDDHEALLAKLREFDAEVVLTSPCPDIEHELATELEREHLGVMPVLAHAH